MLLLLFWFPSLLLLMCQLVSKQILLMTSSLHKAPHREKSIHLNVIVPPSQASCTHHAAVISQMCPRQQRWHYCIIQNHIFSDICTTLLQKKISA